MASISQPRELLNNFSTILRIEIETYQKHEKLLNKFVNPNEKIKNIYLTPISVYTNNKFRNATPEELATIVYPFNEITIRSFGISNTIISKSDEGFTVGELFYNIIELEKIARPQSDWFDGIDAHHVYFEGLHRCSDGSYEIFWGS